MADKVTYKVEGLRELGEAFKLLSADVQGKVGRATTNAMAQIVKKSAIQKAPVYKENYDVDLGDGKITVPRGNIPKNIIVKHLGKRSPLTSEHLVMLRGGKKHGYASTIGSMQEFGTVNQPPKAFLRPALDQNISPAIETGKKRLKQRIDKANSK